MPLVKQTTIYKVFSNGNEKPTDPIDPLATKSDIVEVVTVLVDDITVLESNAVLADVITKVNEIINALKG